MADRVRIIVAAHKKYRMPDDPMYLPVQVGAIGKESIGYQRDDEGDNISELNPSFCELTGMYWAWKHLSSEYIGLVHYRRHFSFHSKGKDPWAAIMKSDELKPYLRRYKVFVPTKRRYYIETLYSHYAHTHYASQLDEVRKVLLEKYPDYINNYDTVIRRRWGYMFNMMVAERAFFSDYCTWLFDILFILRGKLGDQKLSVFQGRFYGRISEIMFNVWLNKMIEENRIKRNQIKEIKCIHMEKIDWLKKGTAFLKAKFMKTKYEGSF